MQGFGHFVGLTAPLFLLVLFGYALSRIAHWPRAATDALTASDISDLVSLEIAREVLAERDETHRRQAFALYELSRLALFGERIAETLQDVTLLVTSAFDNDVAQIWLLAPDGTLELRAAHPHADLRSGRLRPSEHAAFAESLHQRRLVRIGQGTDLGALKNELRWNDAAYRIGR